MRKYTFRTQYNRDEASIRDCNVVKFTAPSKVKKSLSYATKLSTLYDQYCKTGKLPLNGMQPIYDENFVNYDSLIEAQSIIAQASEYFSGLPSEIRSHYGNSLEGFVKAIHSNDEFLVKSGVLKLSENQETQETQKQPSVKPSIDGSQTTVSDSVKPTENVVESSTTTA